jgi:hypothetical protein
MVITETLVGFFVLIFLQVYELWLRVHNLARRTRLKRVAPTNAMH